MSLLAVGRWLGNLGNVLRFHRGFRKTAFIFAVEGPTLRERYPNQLYLAILRDIVARDDVEAICDATWRLLEFEDRHLLQTLIPFGIVLANTN